MTLKRPVTLPQARRWPAAAARRESFCARMGGMRDKLTSDRVARDPRSKINQALAAWDCDRPELLQAAHVSRGVREMKITRKMVGSEAKKNPTDMTVAQTILRQLGGNRLIAMTGARNFFAFPLGLGFELPRNPSGVNQVTITYNPRSDLYGMSFLKTKRSGLDSVTVAKFDDVYADQMREIFTRVTGLETSLGTMGRPSNPARKPARSKAQNLAIALSEQRAGHPRKAAEFFKAAARAKNPLVETVHWSVHKPAMPPHLAIAFYSNKKDAIEAAREAAQRTGKPLAVSKHKTYHFVPEGSK